MHVTNLITKTKKPKTPPTKKPSKKQTKNPTPQKKIKETNKKTPPNTQKLHQNPKTKLTKIKLISEFRLTTVAYPAIWLFISINNIKVLQ